MFKNVASQKLVVYEFDSTTNLPKTGDGANLTAYVSKDYGSVTVLADTSATEMSSTNAKGFYLFDLAQAETNADVLIFTCKSATADMVCLCMPAVVFTVPANFGALSIDTSGRVKVQTNLTKNTALSAFEFVMIDSSDHVTGKTGLTVTAQRSIDGAAFGNCTNTPATELANGVYKIDLSAGDLNGNVITLKFTATGADATIVILTTTA